MAPFVDREWGDKVTDIMWRLKRLADPHAVSAPRHADPKRNPPQGVQVHPQIEQVGNQCIECGFCEAVCPSRNVTTTPRQRIALRREMARQHEDSPVLAQLQTEYEYDEHRDLRR